jgi:hypothetical protein
MKGSTKSIAYDLKDNAVAGFNSCSQDLVMMRAQVLPGIWMFTRQFGAALNIRKQKGKRACGARIHDFSRWSNDYDIVCPFWKYEQGKSC